MNYKTYNFIFKYYSYLRKKTWKLKSRSSKIEFKYKCEKTKIFNDWFKIKLPIHLKILCYVYSLPYDLLGKLYNIGISENKDPFFPDGLSSVDVSKSGEEIFDENYNWVMPYHIMKIKLWEI